MCISCLEKRLFTNTVVMSNDGNSKIFSACSSFCSVQFCCGRVFPASAASLVASIRLLWMQRVLLSSSRR